MTEGLKNKTAKVVVLGDIGRSPRMQYHALSLAENGFKVKIIAYSESKPLPEILENPNISITKLYPLIFDRGPKLVRYAAKALWQTISLLLTLFLTGGCDYLLCQNPPAIPTLPVCRFYCLLSRSKMIIDWHNYAFSIMRMSLHEDHFLLKLSMFLERLFGQLAHHNLCVTYAMKEDLLQNWNVIATVLYDRPPNIFHPITLEDKHEWFLKLSQQYPEFKCSGREELNHPASVERTVFTQRVNGAVEARPDRPGILFSSTSWTEDEDFSLLMEALQVYEATYNLTNRLPKLLCVITGKGPMKQQYIDQIQSKNWQHIKLLTPWLEAADYPKMVASADLGVCLHTSSSGLDLPMKVVDMFGAGLPVCAFDFLCLDELVDNGVNGYTFRNSEELSQHLVAWFQDFPNNEIQNTRTEKIKLELSKFQKVRWQDNWNLRAKKLFEL